MKYLKALFRPITAATVALSSMAFVSGCETTSGMPELTENLQPTAREARAAAPAPKPAASAVAPPAAAPKPAASADAPPAAAEPRCNPAPVPYVRPKPGCDY